MEDNKFIVRSGSGNFAPIEQGLYDVQIVDVLFKENVPSQYGPKNKYQFYLGILNQGPFRGRRIMYSTSTSFTGSWSGGKASNLYTLATLATKEKLDPKIDFNTKTLIGKKIQVLVTPNDRGYADVRQIMSSNVTESLTSEEVSKVMPTSQNENKSTTEQNMTSQDIFDTDFSQLNLDEE